MYTLTNQWSYRLPLFLFTLTYLFIWKILKEFNRRPEKIWVTNLISDQTCSHLALLNKSQSFMSYYFVMIKITIELLEINITSDFFQWDICVQSVRIIGEMCDLWLNIEFFCKVTVTFNLRSPNTNQYLQSKVLRWCAAMIVAVTNHWSMSRHSMRSTGQWWPGFSLHSALGNLLQIPAGTSIPQHFCLCALGPFLLPIKLIISH